MSRIRVLCTVIACSLAAMPPVGCSAFSPSGSTDSKACSDNLAAAYSKLDYAKSKGYSAKVEWAKAEGVLAEAAAAREGKHYDTCVAKVKEAQPYIDASLKGSLLEVAASASGDPWAIRGPDYSRAQVSRAISQFGGHGETG